MDRGEFFEDFDEDPVEELFDSVEIILGQDPIESECVIESSLSEVKNPRTSLEDKDTPEVSSPANVTNRELTSDIIFLGVENLSDDSEEITFREALAGNCCRHCGLQNEEPLSNEFETLVSSIMKTFSEEQKRFSDTTASFVKQQEQHLQEYKETLEFVMLEQRENLEHALAGARPRLSTTTSLAWRESFKNMVQFDCHNADDTYVSDEGTAISTSTPDSVVLARSSNARRPNVLESDRATDSCFRRGWTEDKAARIHLAYKDAAARMQDKSTLVRLQERIERASRHDSLVKTRIFGCGCEQQLVEGHRFQTIIASLIVLNAAFIGITSDMSMKMSLDSYVRHSAGDFSDIPLPSWAIVVDQIFNIAFIAELLFRIVVLESRFCGGPEWRWNLFDSLLVCLSLAEMFLVGLGFNASFMRVLRVVRVSRSLRMLRLLRFTHLVRKLRVMTVAIINCSMMLMWAVLVLLLVTFLFSVVFVNAVSQYVSDASPGNEYVDDMTTYFGSLFMTMVTLFMAVAGGVDWWDVMRLLWESHVVYGVIFMLFVVITVLAVLNVINAIFVNDAMESTRTDHDLRMQGELEETRLMLERLTAIYEKIESVGNGSGEISDRIFIEQVEREEMKMQFALLGLYYTDGFNFFRLLDIEGNKSLGIDQFVMGCLRLKGGALLIDTNILIEDTKHLVAKTSQAHKKAIVAIALQLDALCAKVSSLEPGRERGPSRKSRRCL